MLAIIVEDVVRMESERGGQEVCDLRDARRHGWMSSLVDVGIVVAAGCECKASIQLSF